MLARVSKHRNNIPEFARTPHFRRGIDEKVLHASATPNHAAALAKLRVLKGAQLHIPGARRRFAACQLWPPCAGATGLAVIVSASSPVALADNPAPTGRIDKSALDTSLEPLLAAH
jgi:hypothetical protein